MGSTDSTTHVAITGAGPAACATALSLRKHCPDCRISMFDAAAGPQRKVGETIPPAAVPVLKGLIGNDIQDFLSTQIICPGNISVWGDEQPGFNDYVFDLSGQGYHLDRLAFEAFLQNSARQKEIEIHHQHKLLFLSEENQTNKLSFANNHHTRDVTADFIVDASGSSNALSHLLGIARNVLDEVVFICARYHLPSNVTPPRQTLVEAIPNGWWYTALLPDNYCMVAFCTDRQRLSDIHLDDLSLWSNQLRQSRLVYKYLNGLDLADTVLFKRRAPTSILSAVTGKQWLAVGDAACCYDPVSSAGITKSLMQGQLAGRAISDWVMGKNNQSLIEYQRQVFGEFNQYLGIRDSLYRQEIRFAREPFWQRRRLCA